MKNETGEAEEPEPTSPYGVNFTGRGVQLNTFHVSGADMVVNNVGTGAPAEPSPAEAQRESLAEQRQRFFFDFLRYSLKQAEWTFRLSICFMSGGAAVILAGGVLALVHAGNPDLSYLPIVTSLTGALFTVGGGALAVHARRARAHVTEQADRLDVKIDQDHRLEKATTLIDRVGDPVARDRLNAAAAMKALDMQSSPENMVNRVFPDQGQNSTGELEPGESK
ncbi:hypothetical protein OG194_20710 [Streptomyces sp. NBC_01288]|uniref:TRADD-N-associated membrane domain-containing protein n=1 Tax=Streptomyces sp. NBC_01288 TaxID=2903814 RepID=UPI002E165E04|nr:hypothetical protein OG194_20710 [Streptomyces sp. NBC_01288]